MHYMAWEISVFHAVNNWPNSLRPLFLVATVAPESIVIGLVAIVVAFFLKMYKLAWRLAVLTVGGFGVTFIVKHFFGRPRPQEVLTNLHVRASETGAGFSSGHAMMITVVALAILPYLPKKLRWIPLVMVILTIVSRLYLGVHAPLDVIGGFAVGLGSVCFLQILPTKFKTLLRLS